MLTGIVVALPEELSTLTTHKIAKGHCVFLTETIILAYSGAGASNAHAAAELLITQGANQLISWGCAGALSAELKSGDLVLADNLIDAEGNTIAVNIDWHQHAKTLLEYKPKFVLQCGSLLESKTLVSLSRDKQHLHQQTHALALDMESIAVAKVAHAHALPFLVIRVIADSVTMDLPEAVSYALNEQGDVVFSKLLIFLLLHPSQLPSLIKLGLCFNAAKKTLKSVAQLLDKLIDIHSTIAQ